MNETIFMVVVTVATFSCIAYKWRQIDAESRRDSDRRRMAKEQEADRQRRFQAVD